MLMSSNDAGGHSNKLVVTAVMVLLVPVCLSPKRTEKLRMVVRRGAAIHPRWQYSDCL